ncbi:MAG: DUF4091 domain-containing protein, partial [Mangrovibacterium sp.]|nr:DUF4091 domain-containing protein [Mangrovibacterium sp.]
DPMPRNQGPLMLYPLENYPFYIDVYIPATTPAGTYNGEVALTWENGSKTVPFKLTVYNFTLPEKTTLRSSFGLNAQVIKQYHNLETDQELKQVHDLYLQEMRASRISPTSPFDLFPMKVSFTGVNWTGGIFDRSKKNEGAYSYKITDENLTKNIFATSRDRISLSSGSTYSLSWDILCKEKQDYAVGVRLYNPEGKWLIYDNKLEIFAGDTTWNHASLVISDLPHEAVDAEVVLYPTSPSLDGTATGTVWFDNVQFTEAKQSDNLLSQGNFEIIPDQINVNIDFEEFDKAGARYLDEFAFNAFHLPVQGMGGGTLTGFEQNTPEYDKLMKCYLSQVEKHLGEKGWLGKEYVYWFDEPEGKDYPYVRKGMEVLKNSAPGIKRFITEHQPGPEIMDITDIGCTIWDRINLESIDSLTQQGREFWSYLCTGPKPPYVNLFIDQDAINFRMWCWMSFQYKLSGILVWTVNYWNTNLLSEHNQLQNPWEDPMSYVSANGPYLGIPALWGNGDGRLFYPPNRDINRNHEKFMEGPVRSIRLSILRDGIEDYEYFALLQKLRDKLSPRRDKALIRKADALLHFDETFFTDGKQYTNNPLLLEERRNDVAALIEILQKER